jgi:Co/Zn/Cd efflux system component
LAPYIALIMRAGRRLTQSPVLQLTAALHRGAAGSLRSDKRPATVAVVSHLWAADGTVRCEHEDERDHALHAGEDRHEHADRPHHDHDQDGLGHSHGLVDRSILRSHAGVKAVALSLAILGLTAGAQVAVFAYSSSVALLADLIHNFGDALTAIPLGIAFFLRSVRGERLAGLAVVLAIFVSACVALYETVLRFIHPQHLSHLWVLAAAGLIGFVGNELAAQVRLSAGRRLASAAMTADGKHARIDGFVSLGVVVSAVVVALGAQIADPIIGLAITSVILKITWDSWHTVRHAEIDLDHIDDDHHVHEHD